MVTSRPSRRRTTSSSHRRGVPTGDSRPTQRRVRGGGPRRPSPPGESGSVTIDRIAVGQRDRVAVRHDDAGATAEQLDGVRERRGDHRPAGGDRRRRARRRSPGRASRRAARPSTLTPTNWVSAGTSRYVSSKVTEPATPVAQACRISEWRYWSPSRANTFGWVTPATVYRAPWSQIAQQAPIASIACSMPLPGPRRPHVSSCSGWRLLPWSDRQRSAGDDDAP